MFYTSSNYKYYDPYGNFIRNFTKEEKHAYDKIEAQAIIENKKREEERKTFLQKAFSQHQEELRKQELTI